VTGLLVNFINSKAASYVQPSRKGTARGDPVGMKEKKYLATLLALTTLRVKDQARELKIPEKLLSKWRTEKPFDNQFIDHVVEFDRIFCNHVRDHWIKEFERITKARNLPVAEYAKFLSEYKPEPYDGFGDRMLYGKDLIRLLGNAIDTNRTDLQLATMRAVDRLLKDFGKEPRVKKSDGAQQIIDAIKTRSKNNQTKIIDAIRSILVKDEATEDDRKRAIGLLEFLGPE
jgi:hypothetical protein